MLLVYLGRVGEKEKGAGSAVSCEIARWSFSSWSRQLASETFSVSCPASQQTKDIPEKGLLWL
jgi:hypothetical protein